MLVDERDPGTRPRVLFYLEHAIQDASLARIGRASHRSPSACSTSSSTPTGDPPSPLRALPRLPAAGRADEPSIEAILDRPGVHGSTARSEQKAQAHAIAHVVPEHLAEVRTAQA